MTAETTTTKNTPPAVGLDEIANTLVSARRAASGLSDYPGTPPADLATAYLIQDRAIELWREPIGGWKVGRIPPAVEDQFGCDRLAGPIFADTIFHQAGGQTTEMPVFADGGAAVEAEFVAIIRDDTPADKVEWSRDEAEAMIGEVCIGLEVASSPLVGINDRGPAVIASDFGNNLGLIVGPGIPGWKDRDPKSLCCATYIDDELVGEGGAFGLTGGITRSVQFILELAAKRNLPLRAGQFIATGQTTGIHDVTPGQVVRMPFGEGGGDGELTCTVVAAAPK
jgi:2-keto-4-pentenoate hydratase